MTKQASFKIVLHKLNVTEVRNKLNLNGLVYFLKIFILKHRFTFKKILSFGNFNERTTATSK